MFFLILIIILAVITILIFSKIKVDISNIRITTKEQNKRHLNKDYAITASWYILGKLRLFKINITKTKLEKINLKNKIKDKVKKLDIKLIKNINNFDRETITEIKKIKAKPKIEYLKLRLDIGTEDAAITAYIVAVLSSLLGMVLKEQSIKKERKKFIVNPVYINENLLKLEFDCIFKIKMIHIIYIIYILKKKRRDDKNVRTSNRRSYGYSYE